MAGIQLPNLKRMDPVEEQAAPALKVDIADGSRAQAVRTGALEQFGQTVEDFAQKQVEHAADTEATKRANEYEVSFKQMMYGDEKNPGIKFQQGDPTELYNKFDETMKGKFDSLKGDDLSGLTQRLVEKRLTDKANSLNYQRLTEYGTQQAKYDKSVSDSGVFLEKQNFTDAATAIQVGDDKSFARIDDIIGNIRSLRLRQGMKNGAVAPNENGESIYVGDDGKPMRVNVLPSTKVQLQKDLSEGISNMADNLIKAGDVDKAHAVLDRYSQYIIPDKKKSLIDDFRKAEVKSKAYTVADSLGGLGPDATQAALQKVENPEIREQALKVIDERQRMYDNMKNRSSKAAFDRSATVVMKRMASDSPFTGPNDMESDPVVANTIAHVTDARQKKALYEMVIAPKESSTTSTVSMQDLAFGKDPDHPDGLKGMSPTDFAVKLQGLSKADRSAWQHRYENANMESNAQQSSNMKLSERYLKAQLLQTGYIKQDSYTKKLDAKSEAKFTESRNELLEQLDAQGNSPMNPNELNKWAQKYAADKAAGQAFTPPPRNRFQGSPRTQKPGDPAQPPPNAPPSANDQLIKGRTRVQWAMEFQKVNKRLPDTKTSELQNFIKDQE